MWHWVVYVWKELVQELDPVTLSQSPLSKEAEAFYSKPNVILPRPQLHTMHPDQRIPVNDNHLAEEYLDDPLNAIDDLQNVLEAFGASKDVEDRAQGRNTSHRTPRKWPRHYMRRV